MNNWNNLSMAQRAGVMRLAVENGVYDLDTIRAAYNEFAEGGDTKPDWSYDSWKRQIAEHMGIRPDEDNTYDYEAYFNKYPEEAWKMLKGDPTAHFTDEFKTVYHPTFSSKSIGNDGSIYSGVKNPRTNPQGLVGGSWSPDYKVFTMSPDGYRGPVSMDERKWYLENAEDNGVQLREADGSLPIYDGILWGGVLPNVTVYGMKHSNGGKIHIKPENRGKFTRLKERTGHSATWFKEHGTPAQRKMATFALNARHWKHGLGGNLFDGESQPTQQMSSWVANYNPTPVATTSSYAPNGRYGINGKPYEQWAEEKKAAVAAQEWADNQPQLKPMTMTKKEREIAKVKGDRNAEYERKQELQRKGVEALGILGTFARPSTWAALPFIGIEHFGEGFGTEWVNTPIDLVTPFAWNKGTQVTSNIPYKEYRLSRAINKAVKENPVITGYNRNPALKDVGDLWDYQTYLQQVYPNTKVKDVQWHGSITKNLQNFSTNAIGTNMPIKGSVGMYLAPERYTTSTYGRKGGIYPVLLNTENPYITKQIFALSKNGVNVAKITPEVKNTLLAENDAVIAPRRGEIAFFNPDNALILGSDKDLQGFRTFMNEPKGLLSDEPLIARGTSEITVENAASITPKVNWDADYWFKTISGRNSYSAEEAAELALNIPEYRAIEQRLFNEGKLVVDVNGNIVVKGSTMSPQEYIMRQSEKFQKMNPKHHYTGVPDSYMQNFENNSINVESWTDRLSPSNVREYAFGNFGKRKDILDNIKYFENLKNQNGSTEDIEEWLTIYRNQLKEFDDNIAQMERSNQGKVYDITYPNDYNDYKMDAAGAHWARIPSDIVADAGIPKKYLRPGTMATDDIVYAANDIEIDPVVVNIDNVMDTYNGTLLNETIIPKQIPKKSVLGSTGWFTLEGPNRNKLYRSLVPPFIGLGTLGTMYGASTDKTSYR